MGTSSKPRWFRLEVGTFSNVKIATLRERKRFESIALWIDALAYSVENLTDGYIPRWLPRRHGFRKAAIQPLIDLELWHEANPIPDMQLQGYDGWLIHDFLSYQPSKEHWETVAEQRRIAAEERWHSL